MNEEYCKNCPLIEEIAKLRAEIEELKKPAKHSGKSSLPPSSDQNRKPYPKREKTGRKPGGQPGHKGHCGRHHFVRKENILEQRQVVDIPEIKPYVKEYQQKVGICKHCGTRNIGQFPESIAPNVQIGEKSKALFGYLNVHAHMSNDKIAQFFEDIFGLAISKGTVNNKINELAFDLEQKYNNILEKLRGSHVLGSDETTARINGKRSYLWIFQNLAYSFFVTSARSFKTIQ